jgi:lysophospholipase L1-like esterase
VWPQHFVVFLRPLGGECLKASLSRLLVCLGQFRPDVCVFHSGVNDLCRSPVAAEVSALFSDSYASLSASLIPFVGTRFVFSSLFQTRVPLVNICVRAANGVLRQVCSEFGWKLLSNDVVFQEDLKDDVHLNASGVVKVHRNIVHVIQSVMGLKPGIFV